MFNNYTLTNILRHINSGKDYKACCLVSKQFYNIINQLFPGGDKFANHLLTLLKLFPDENWNYLELSRNPNITIDYITENLDKDWYPDCLTCNRRFTLTDILNNPKIPWQKNIITYNRNIPASYEEWEFILQHPEYKWTYKRLCRNNGLSWDIIVNNLDKFGNYISKNPNITLDIVRNNPQLNWNFYKMSYNSSITLELVEEFINEDWDFWVLVEQKNIINHPRSMEFFYNNLDKIGMRDFSQIATQEIIEKYPNLNWQHDMLSRNKNITFEFTKKHPEINWNYERFSENPNMNINILLNNLEINWDYSSLSSNLSIKITDIFNHPELPWFYRGLSIRKDLTWRIVAANPHLFDFDLFAINKF